jgi:ATP synthase protein I
MMPFHNPTPERKQSDADGRKGGGMMSSWIQAEKLMQIALVLPCAAFLGWLAGSWADRHFHQSWITVVGILLGSASGLTYAVQAAIGAERSSDSSQPGANGSGSQDGSKKDSQDVEP